MTYGITVRSHGGQHEVTAAYGDVPDGVHQIDGHDGAPMQAAGGATSRTRSIQVGRRDHEDRHVIGAQHSDTDWS